MLPKIMGKYNPFSVDCVSLNARNAKKAIARIIVNAAPAIVVKSVRLRLLLVIEEKIKQGPDI
ncbi:MAG: hypothetical protein WAV32_06225 [Halobacteriota archaeon]